MLRNRKAFQDGSAVLEGILETKMDVDADFLEHIGREIVAITRKLNIEVKVDQHEILLRISELQEATALSRESFVDKQRVVSALLKCGVFENKERFRILIKDINSMLEYASFIFMRLEFLQNTLLGLINLDQNKTIKIFTIMSVIFLPPTLIASIYGMNFRGIPELQWPFGYPMAIVLIICSSLATLFIFKSRKWL
jgi:magnesium transporter